jgi:hypothetical protein
MITASTPEQVLLNESFTGVTFPPQNWLLGPKSTVGGGELNWERTTASWEIKQDSAPASVISRSLFQGWQRLDPDHWLFTPEIILPEVPGHNYYLKFSWRGGSNGGANHDLLTIYVASEDFNDNIVNLIAKTIEGNDIIFNQRVLNSSHNAWNLGMVSLGEFTDTVRIGFRHWDTQAGAHIIIDDIEVYLVPDYELEILNYSWTPIVKDDENIEFTINVKNQGANTIEAKHYEMAVFKTAGDIELFKTAGIVDIDSFETKSITFTWTDTPKGHQQVYLQILFTEPDLIIEEVVKTDDFWVLKLTEDYTLHETKFPNTEDPHYVAPNWTPNFPFAYDSQGSVSQIIYRSDEVMGENSGLITHLVYRYNGGFLPQDVEHKIYFQHETKNGFVENPNNFVVGPGMLWTPLRGSETATPAVLVFSGKIEQLKSHIAGLPNDLLITLDIPFYYDHTLGNLLITSMRAQGDRVEIPFGTGFFIQPLHADNMHPTLFTNGNFDPNTFESRAPNSSLKHVPHFSFVMWDAEVVTLHGNVTGDVIDGNYRIAGQPIQNARIQHVGSPNFATTDAQGKYNLTGFPIENNGLHVSAFGYEPKILPTIKIEDIVETQILDMKFWEMNIELAPATPINLFGTIVAGHNSNITVGGAKVTVSHANGYSRTMTTTSDGTFNLEIMPGSFNYNLTVEHLHYRRYSTTIRLNATETEHNVGNVPLHEIFYAPVAVRAEHIDPAAGATELARNERERVELTWFSPTTPVHNLSQMVDIKWESNVHFGVNREYTYAHRWTRSQLTALGLADDDYLYSVSFSVARDYNRQHDLIIEIYNPSETDGANLNPGEPIYVQVIPSYLIETWEWNTITLDSFVSLGNTGDIWVAIVANQGSGGPIVGIDSGPINKGYGNLLKWDGNWITFDELEVGSLLNMQESWTIVANAINIPDRSVAVQRQNNKVTTVTQNPTIFNGFSDTGLRMANDSSEKRPLLPVSFDMNTNRSFTRATGYNIYRVVGNNVLDSTKWGSPIIKVTDTSYTDFAESLQGEFYYIVVAEYGGGFGDFGGHSAPTVSNRVKIETVELIGTVVSLDNQPVKNARISLTAVGFTDLQYVTHTDDWGVFKLTARLGEFNIVISADGYIVYEKNIWIGEDKHESYTLVDAEAIIDQRFVAQALPTGWFNPNIATQSNAWITNTNHTFTADSRSMISNSFRAGAGPNPSVNLFPDAWLFTEEVELPTDGQLQLSFVTRSIGRTINREHFSVYVVFEEFDHTDSVANNRAKLLTLLEPNNDDETKANHQYLGFADAETGVEAFEYTQTTQNWLIHTIDLAPFAGEKVRLAFRHWMTGLGSQSLVLDDVKILHVPMVSVVGYVADWDIISSTDSELNPWLADVEVIWESDSVIQRSTISDFTDENGMFMIHDQAPGTPFKLTFELEGYRIEEYKGVVPMANSTEPEEEGDFAGLRIAVLNSGAPYTMNKFYIVGGRLVDIQGSALPGWNVAIHHNVDNQIGAMITSVETNSEGKFLLEGIITGTYTIRITHASLSQPADLTKFNVNGKDDLSVEIIIDENGNVGDDDEVVPVFATTLHGNHPNPFNPTTSIAFDLAKDSRVRIDVYNVKGQHINTLIDDNMKAGTHRAIWNGVDDNNRSVASGIYFYRMQTEGFSSTKKMILMK